MGDFPERGLGELWDTEIDKFKVTFKMTFK